ncbi:MAG: ABC transporter permease [Anaerolineales bacterium]|nr:ABC transporter permease [Anaerolineales bacterium]MCB9128586.1 ABC transporter permease [Ardenticatenales bacterium]MCB9172524.1 ABC transporter permease [Ardenticatenales bacterium]
MLSYIIRRTLVSIPVILLMAFVVFYLIRQVPAGPFDFVGDRALPPAIRENLEKRYHLDWPLMWQFTSYVVGDDVALGVCNVAGFIPGCDIIKETPEGVSRGLIRGDLGESMKQRGRSINTIVGNSFPVSLQLGILSIILGLLIGIPAGVLAALRQNSWVDYLASFVAVLGLSIPSMVIGPVLIVVFAVKLGWLPAAQWGAPPPYTLGIIPPLTWDFFKHTIMPVIALGTGLSASIARLTRASLLQVIREDYIRTARAKGLKERVVIVRHALKNSLIPVVTILGPMVAGVVTGTFVIELIFAIPGMGKYFIDSITNRDYTLITSVSVIYGVLLVAANMLVDITYGWLDPRIRLD